MLRLHHETQSLPAAQSHVDVNGLISAVYRAGGEDRHPVRVHPKPHLAEAVREIVHAGPRGEPAARPIQGDQHRRGGVHRRAVPVGPSTDVRRGAAPEPVAARGAHRRAIAVLQQVRR